MVIGKGLVASNFAEYETLDDFLIFASGVSHSKSCTPQDLERERSLFKTAIETHPSKTLVYFSTTSISDPDLKNTLYITHKLDMENRIRQACPSYHIFRLSNLAGKSGNPTTLLNFFYTHIHDSQPFLLWTRSERNVIDIADVFHTADYILRQGLFVNQTINIANPSNYPVSYIVSCMERHTGKKAIFTAMDKGGSFTIDTSIIQPVFQQLKIGFGNDYLPLLLEKYYPGQ